MRLGPAGAQHGGHGFDGGGPIRTGAAAEQPRARIPAALVAAHAPIPSRGICQHDEDRTAERAGAMRCHGVDADCDVGCGERRCELVERQRRPQWIDGVGGETCEFATF